MSFEELSVLKEEFVTAQESHEDRSNHTKARNYVAGLIVDMSEEEGFELSKLEIRIASTAALMTGENGIVLTSLLGQVNHIETDLNVISDAILHLEELELITMRQTRPLAEEHNNIVIEFTEEIEWDEEVITEVERLTEFNYPLPSLRPTKLRTKNKDSGMYYSYSCVMAGHQLNMHEGDLNLGHLNSLGQLQFQLNHSLMAEFDEFEMMSEKAKEDALAHNDSPEDFIDESNRVYEAMELNSFSFDWFRDSRGRKYCRGYHASCHGTEFKKHSLHFAQKRLIE
jgi:hypothetical protein